MSETSRAVTIAGRAFLLRAGDVERAMRDALPEPVTEHFVVVGPRRFPPKQIISRVTGLDRAQFTSHHARRVLARLGFAAGRRTGNSNTAGATSDDHGGVLPDRRRPSAETLEPFVGQWVATSSADVLVAAPDPRAVVSWLAEHGRVADSMFRVPRHEFEVTGLAPE
jgi:hypothetical protein